MKSPTDEQIDLTPLLDLILEKVPAAANAGDEKLPLTAQIFNLAYDNFMGRLAICRIYKGTLKTGQRIFSKTHEGASRPFKITKLFTFEGISRKEVTEAIAGDIVLFAGLEDAYIGETVCEDDKQETLPSINIDEPTISLNFLVNDSPFAGREGKFVTGRQIRERLERELEINVGLKIEFTQDTMKVYGRGELHIAILIENMRREGFELQVSQPQAIIKDIDGVKSEPYEEVTIDVPEECSGVVIEKLGKRRGIMQDMKTKDGQVRMIYEVPTRGLLGFKGQFVVDTRGNGILCSRFLDFKPYAGDIQKQEFGSMVSMMDGKALAFALWNLQERGVLYINPGTEVYEGMLIGNVTKGEDMDVNPIKGKNLTNVRKTSSDEAIYLTPSMPIDIEKGLEIMGSEDYLEVTPLNTRLRKKYLTKIDRSRAIR
jgi:GTP-binding protein